MIYHSLLYSLPVCFTECIIWYTAPFYTHFQSVLLSALYNIPLPSILTYSLFYWVHYLIYHSLLYSQSVLLSALYDIPLPSILTYSLFYWVHYMIYRSLLYSLPVCFTECIIYNASFFSIVLLSIFLSALTHGQYT